MQLEARWLGRYQQQQSQLVLLLRWSNIPSVIPFILGGVQLRSGIASACLWQIHVAGGAAAACCKGAQSLHTDVMRRLSSIRDLSGPRFCRSSSGAEDRQGVEKGVLNCIRDRGSEGWNLVNAERIVSGEDDFSTQDNGLEMRCIGLQRRLHACLLTKEQQARLLVQRQVQAQTQTQGRRNVD